MIGVKGASGEESFDIFVVTPKWLLMNYTQKDILFGMHHMIVFDYSYSTIVKKLETYINNLEGENWSELAEKINLIGQWEFYNYKAKPTTK